MKVKITVHENTTYTDVIEMSAKEFKDLSNRLENGTGFRNQIKEEIASKITCSSKNWLDSNVDDVEIEKDHS